MNIAMNNGEKGELIHENEGWRKQLALLEDENIQFKTRLADILKSDFVRSRLEELEYFQNRFLKMDEQLSLLKHEVREQLYHLQQDRFHINGEYKRIMDVQRKLEVKIIIIKENFEKLSTEFNGYLMVHFGQQG
ncbi:hypothetical protein [uncultured Chitinophaga sp.]|uniref:hypothetical protein n=1 Tax=uncultured Chitinophaga sp. TaxID=339340 RepID=UPI00261D648B|nr:hypothetical protein [uncultured Chitinophaga sp.]